MEPTFGKIRDYTQWTRRDRPERASGGVAVCFKEGVQAQHLDVVPPPHMEVMFFRVLLADRSAILLCAMYRPPRQGPASLQYLTEALDDLMLESTAAGTSWWWATSAPTWNSMPMRAS
ncbi:hypothetical protein GWK47_039455 [Chionoecetes opilio]|uniref:Uncharacterized protein n=1 Tax=Chionoecetes opilio TaxID=41210 RepID=A0A8J4YK44_CHIOP|nr:hypothetical protein GWK47_039455 [Chionoecetes opilio]